MALSFQTFAQRTTYSTVAEWLPQLFDQAWPLDDAPGFGITVGSAFAIAMVRPLGDGEAVVHVSSVVVYSPDVSPSLMRFLLTKNETIFFGRFGLNDDDDVVCSHCALGSTLDPAELQMTVGAVLTLADDYDDEIVARWGGKRAIDLIR